MKKPIKTSNRVSVNMTLPKEVVKLLDQEAKRTMTSRSQVVVALTTHCLPVKEKI